jgi:RHS repeat-associated protein
VRAVDKVSGAVVTDRRFVWCEQSICEERDSSGATVVRSFYGGGMLDNGLSLFYTQDHLLNVREMTDVTGTIRARYDYDPYGRVTKLSGEEDSAFTFTGHFFHPATGLLLSPTRAYDPNLGRWLSEDPIGFAGGSNKYAYVSSNPLNSVDIFGEDGEAATAGAADPVPLPQAPPQTPGKVIQGPWAPPAPPPSPGLAAPWWLPPAIVLSLPTSSNENPDEEPWQGPEYDPQKCKKRARNCTCWGHCSIIQQGLGVPSNIPYPQHTSAFGSGPDCRIARANAIANAKEVLRLWILRNPWFQGRIRTRHCEADCPD